MGWVLGFVEGLQGQGLEFGDEFVESAGVVEPVLVALLLGGDLSGDGSADGENVLEPGSLDGDPQPGSGGRGPAAVL